MQELLVKGADKVCGRPHDAKLTTDTYKSLASCGVTGQSTNIGCPTLRVLDGTDPGGKGRVADWGITLD